MDVEIQNSKFDIFTMDSSRYTQGWQKLQEIHGDRGTQVLNSLAEVSPDLARFIAEFAFADIYCRPELDAKTRQLITIASLTTLGHAQPQLKAHIHGALNVGCSEAEIIEVILQIAVYGGFPAALNAMMTAKAAFEERDPK
jgi:4-carboxymuconolactone decarboxylase